MIFIGTYGVDHPVDLRIWVIPPPAPPLLHGSAFQETRAVPTARLFADAIGPVGRLNRTARVCRARLPGLHPWREGWIRHIAALNLDPGQP
ncbi:MULTISPECIES: hypothetical protein [Rhodococcus]|uniref:hypothetical protein n=1 Tax=Rhodococcus TaxID=1827 RepID=UPI000C9CCE2C|nr:MULTISPECIES: hypothetical protein [Rhodococcus]PND52486.1 hypothetical protein CQZ88_08395 [Rhodococcus sp. ENV425]WKX01791.1 hypothetical protein Q3O43_27845 [Rhodococcus aetherivorans]